MFTKMGKHWTGSSYSQVLINLDTWAEVLTGEETAQMGKLELREHHCENEMEL